MKNVEVVFAEKKAKLLVEKGKFDEVAVATALKNAGYGGGNRVP